MAITVLDPDNNPNTRPPALKFGTTSDSTGSSGNTSLRKEYPTEVGSASLSEYYRDGGVVPSSIPSTNTTPYIAETLRVPNIHPPDEIINIDIGNEGGQGGSGNTTIVFQPSLLGDPFYLRLPVANVTTLGTARFIWGTNIQFDATNQNIITIMTTPVEYLGYVYKRSLLGGDYQYTDGGVLYYYFGIERKPVSTPVSINDGVPTSGSISFSQLYGSTKVINQNYTVPALNTTTFTGERGREPDGSLGAPVGIGKRNFYPGPSGNQTPNATLKMISFDIGFNAKITVTASSGSVPIYALAEYQPNSVGALYMSIRYPGFRVIGPNGGVVLQSFNAGDSLGQINRTAINSSIATASVDNLTQRGTYYFEFCAQIFHRWQGPERLHNNGITWTTPQFEIKVETT